MREMCIRDRLKGGSNLALVNAMANVIWNEGLADKKFIDEHTKGFDEFLKVIEKYTPEYAEPITHIPAETIRRAARMYATTKPAMILYGMGVCPVSYTHLFVYALGFWYRMIKAGMVRNFSYDKRKPICAR